MRGGVFAAAVFAGAFFFADDGLETGFFFAACFLAAFALAGADFGFLARDAAFLAPGFVAVAFFAGFFLVVRLPKIVSKLPWPRSTCQLCAQINDRLGAPS